MNYLTVLSRLEVWWSNSDYSSRLSFLIGLVRREYVEDFSLQKAKKLAGLEIRELIAEGSDFIEGVSQYFWDLERLRIAITNKEERRREWHAFFIWQTLSIEERKELLSRMELVLGEEFLGALNLPMLELRNFEELPGELMFALKKSVPPVSFLKKSKKYPNFFFLISPLTRSEKADLLTQFEQQDA